MTDHATTPNESITDQAKEAYQEARPWIRTMGRVGYASKGIVYVTLGLLVLRALVGLGSADVETRDALLAIERAPLGEFLLLLLAAGLVGYVIWRFVQAIIDPEERGTGLKGLAKRGVYIFSGIAYASLVILAVQMVVGAPAYGGEASEDWSARLLSHRNGQWAVILVGAGIVAVGLYQFYLAFTGIFRHKLKEEKMSRLEKLGAITSGRLGFISRGIVIGAIGVFFIRSALIYDPDEAAGLGEILLTFALTPYGPWLLGLMGIGFIAFGLYIILIARFGRYVV
jgi:hypothetical protein